MTIAEALQTGLMAKTDAEVLLAHVLGQPRTYVLAHDTEALIAAQVKHWEEVSRRRIDGEPVAYITGLKEFYGREFSVNASVLIPRPATEELVTKAKELVLGKVSHASGSREIDTGISCVWDIWKSLGPETLLVDIGTGSGCIAITLACELHNDVIATDVSEDALRAARHNAETLGVGSRITWKQGSGLDPIADLDRPFVIVSNPPYVRMDAKLESEVIDFEPSIALFGGTDGADILRAIAEQTHAHPQSRGLVIECRSDQADIFTN